MEEVKSNNKKWREQKTNITKWGKKIYNREKINMAIRNNKRGRKRLTSFSYARCDVRLA